MHQRGRQGRQRHHAEQQEGERRREEVVERIGGPDVGVGDGGAGGGENARDVRPRHLGEPGDDLAPARQFAEPDQHERQHRAGDHPQAGPEQALLDRVAHQQDAAERERDAADPDDPLRSEPLLQVGEVGTARP